MEDRQISTKEKILLESMKLFSVQGFEAVSVRNIAAAVGVRDSALYKHFSNKQAIFDAIVEASRNKFLEKYQEMLQRYYADIDFCEMCLQMFRFQTQDKWIVSFRQMLIIEQFKNPYIAEIYKELFINMPIENQARIFSRLIQLGVMKDGNARVMSMELYAPFFLYHTIHMTGEELEQLEKELRQHVLNFEEMYSLVKSK